MIDISLTIASRNRLDSLYNNTLASVIKTCPKDLEVLVLEDSSDEHIRNTDIRNHISNLSVCEIPFKSSCAHTWNLSIILSRTQYVIICADDLELRPGWYEALIEQINLKYDYILIDNHRLFCINKGVIPYLGWPDENFKGGCFEDCDMMVRVRHKKIRLSNITSNWAIHKDAAQSTKVSWDYTPNKKYFGEKWGIEEYIPSQLDNYKQLISDTDWYPSFTKLYKEKYERGI